MEGKAMKGMSRKREGQFIDLIEAIGGRPADGGPWDGDALHADEASFDRAAALAFHNAEPQSADEAAALERWDVGAQ